MPDFLDKEKRQGVFEFRGNGSCKPSILPKLKYTLLDSSISEEYNNANVYRPVGK
jgi:hypothetical protein